MEGIFLMILIGGVGSALCKEDNSFFGIFLVAVALIAAFYGVGCYGWAFIAAEVAFCVTYPVLLVPIGIVIKHCYFLVVVIDCILSLFIGVIVYNLFR